MVSESECQEVMLLTSSTCTFNTRNLKDHMTTDIIARHFLLLLMTDMDITYRWIITFYKDHYCYISSANIYMFTSQSGCCNITDKHQWTKYQALQTPDGTGKVWTHNHQYLTNWDDLPEDSFWSTLWDKDPYQFQHLIQSMLPGIQNSELTQ